ncbi:MAG: transglutaminase family protein [Promethearchaeota archaeon]
MKIKIALAFLCIIIFPTIYSIDFALLTYPYNSESFPLLAYSYEGISNYNISQSVTYDVELNFTLTHKSGSGTYIFKFVRLDNRGPTSSLTPYCPPYQESVLLTNFTSGNIPSETSFGQHDKFNNTYDSFNASLAPDETVNYYQKYNITLNEIYFHDIVDADIGVYDTSDVIFDLYCNHSEPYYERDDLSLINLSNSIVTPLDNPVEKAKKICDWVSNYLTYNEFLPQQEMGALWAYNNQQGDCSEFSSLMITLLRIQGIPARKICGFLISDNPLIRPKVGSSWNFYSNELSTTMLRHAWVEYYVEDVGWIACDPTWHKEINYFNRIDFLRFSFTVGSNIFFPPSETISEFGNPIFGYNVGATFNYDYQVDISVFESDLTPIPPFPLFPIIFISIGLFAVIIVIVLLIKRRSKKETFGY